MLANSQPPASSRWKKVLAISSSISMGLSAGITMASSVYSQGKSLVASGISGTITAIGSAFRFYAFNGKSIINEEEPAVKPEDNNESNPATVSPNNLTQATQGDAYARLASSEGAPTPSRSWTATSTQGMFTAFALANNLAGRYFTLNVMLDLFSIELGVTPFVLTIALDMLIKQLYDMSNEVYECNEKLGEWVNSDETSPFYVSMFKPISGPLARKAFSAVGALEHTLVDDLLPWVGFIPKSAIIYLNENEKARNIVLGASAVPTLVLLGLVMIQTYFFEGAHTEKHLAKISGEDTPNQNHTSWPLSLLKTLQKMLLLMGPFHGSAAALPVYTTLNEMFSLSTDEFNVSSFIPTMMTFVLVTLGMHYSEVRESTEQLQEKIVRAGNQQQPGSQVPEVTVSMPSPRR